MLCKATRVDGVYDSDPETNSSATKYDELSYTTALAKNLRVMDAAALSLCRDQKLPILVFNLTVEGSIMSAMLGANIGTLIQGE